MKRKLLVLMMPVLGAFFGHSQAEITVTAPTANGATTGLRAPNGTTGHTTIRGVIIVPASELTQIPSGTTITKLSLLVSTAGGPADGTIQYYLENTADVTNLKPTDWATLTSTMTSVYTGPFVLPTVAGPTAELTLPSGFVYTGGSLYVAYDYAGTTFTATGAIYSANNALGASWKGLATATLPAAATITQSSGFRPCFRFTFTNPFVNELNVTGVAGEKGIFNNTISQEQTVTSLITNTSVAALTSVPVTLTITGANPYTATQTIPSISAGGTTTLLFTGVPTVALGAQTITISLPSDENNTNNSRTFSQQVQCDTISYAQSPVASGAVGFNTGAGLIGVRHVIPNNIETFVKSVANYFPITASNANNTMKGILLDGNGIILDSTALFTITAGMLGTRQNFDFINGAIDVSGSTIYVGFRQTANATTGYFPFANQSNSYVDPDAGATFDLFGGTAPSPLGAGLGYMMIEATLTFGGFDVANSSTSGSVCTNSPLTISPPAGFSNYNFFVDGISVQNGPLATYTTAPLTTGLTFNVDITNGSCPVSSNVQTISIVSALVNDIAAGICPGQTYTFGSQTLVSGGTYSDTLVSISGCDSIVNLTLAALSPSSSTINAGICQGDSYTLGSQTLTTSGTYTEIIPNAAGCDSTITLNLTVNSATTSSETLIVCENVYQFGSQTLNATGTYTETFANVAGCDSVVTLNLTMNPPVSLTAIASGVTINASGSASINTYQWIDCATGDPVVGATSSSFSPTVNGSYAVVGGNPAGCVETSNCATVSTIGVDELSLDASVSLYPNPATTLVHAVSTGSDIVSYTIVDAKGRIVLSEIMDGGAKEVEFSVQSFENGTYILELTTVKGTISKSFVKK